jgi:hypothetical protein
MHDDRDGRRCVHRFITPVVLLAASCAEPNPVVTPDPTVGVGTLSATSDGDELGDAGDTDKLDLGIPTDLPSAETGDCVSVEDMAELEQKPVDIILFIDTSDSMSDVSAAIEMNINKLLSDIVTMADIDVRVIVIAAYGTGDSICFTAPLGPDDCDPLSPAPPTGPQLFQYAVGGLGSGGLLDTMIETYTGMTPVAPAAMYAVDPIGWKDWARPEASKTFLVVTDARSMDPSIAHGTKFDTDLLALAPEQFGTPAQRNYVLHTIAGMDPNAPPELPWPPDAPMVNGGCDGNEPGQPVQQVSILTGGLRFSLCRADLVGALFGALAASVVETTPVRCDFAIPEPPPGEELDPTTLQVEYEAGGVGPVELFHQVPSLAACEPAAFWVDATDIHLCPDACTLVTADDAALVRVRYGCDVGYDPNG